MKVKQEYEALLDSGELLDMFPQLSGSWRKDGKLFTKLWEQNIEAIKKIDKGFNEDE